jgi:hypothetical protein
VLAEGQSHTLPHHTHSKLTRVTHTKTECPDSHAAECYEHHYWSGWAADSEVYIYRERATQRGRVLTSSVGLWEGPLGVRITQWHPYLVLYCIPGWKPAKHSPPSATWHTLPLTHHHVQPAQWRSEPRKVLASLGQPYCPRSRLR